MPILMIAAAVLMLGCCGSMSSSSCKTFDASCKKSCAVLSAEEGLEYGSCVSECRSVFLSNGIDPDSCCPEEMKAGKVCEIDCEGEGPGCISECRDNLKMFTGLDPDDCVVPY